VTDRPNDSHDRRPPRVAVLWSRLSGYLHACLRALADQGVDILVVHQQAEANAPFDSAAVTAGIRSQQWADGPDEQAIDRLLDEFEPDAILVSSWNFGAYRKVCRKRQGRTLRIFGMDNQWHGTPKQWAGIASARFVLRPTYDAVFLCDERQAAFAARLGFPAERLVWGLYTGDRPLFSEVARRRGSSLPPQRFLFVGRLVPEKGVDVLAAAYRRYRDLVDEPWPLTIAGTGPDEALLAGTDGVTPLGFVQPTDLPDVFADAGCLVLPSRFEPWAVVIHEAAAAGLPVVCTRACGASTRLVLDGYNGVVVTPGDPTALAAALVRVHSAGDHERRAMGAASEALALQYSPQQWAERLLGRIPELRALVGLPATPGASAQVMESYTGM
jgi:glycosyltransferase involved in cell wall biosynthesis